MSQSFPQVQVEGRTAVFSGDVSPSTREDAADGETFTIWQLVEFRADGLVSEHCHRCVRHGLGSCVSGTHPRRQRGLPSYWCWWPPTPGVCGGDD